MRVLIAARHSPLGRKPIGGVQTWSATVGGVLAAAGHEVKLWEPRHALSGIFDLGIAANFWDTREALKFCKRHIVISHGIIGPERPSAKFVAFTSEEVRDHWKVDGPIIRQPIDLSFWSPADDRRIYLTRFSYRHGLTFVTGIARDMNLKYSHVRQATKLTARQILRQSVCVLASGRAALEAMACGVPTVLVDDRSSYQSALMERDILRAMRHNYSGRGGMVPDVENVSAAIQEEIAFGSRRAHVEQYHDSRKIVDELLEAAA